MGGLSLRPQRGTGGVRPSLSLRPHHRPARPQEVDLTDIAQQERPIEELQQAFRAAREPVEQAQELFIPAGVEINLPTALPTSPSPLSQARQIVEGATPEERALAQQFMRTPLSKQLGGASVSELAERVLGPQAAGGEALRFQVSPRFGPPREVEIPAVKGMAKDAVRLAAGLVDFFQTPEGLVAAGATVAGGGVPVALFFAGTQAVEIPSAVKTYLENPTPENLQQALLLPGFVALLSSAAGRGLARKPGVSREPATVERAAEAKAAPPVASERALGRALPELELLGATEVEGTLNLRFGPLSKVETGKLRQLFEGFDVGVEKLRGIPRAIPEQVFKVTFFDEAGRISPQLARKGLSERLGGEQRISVLATKRRLEAEPVPPPEGFVLERTPRAGSELIDLELLGAMESGGIIKLRFGPASKVKTSDIQTLFKGVDVEVAKIRGIHETLGARPTLVQNFDVTVFDEAGRISGKLAQKALKERLGGAQRFTMEPVRQRLSREAASKPGPTQKVLDEFGDTIERGGRVVDSLGRSGKVRSVGALVQDLETGKAVFREDTLKVDFGKGPEPVSISEVTVKRHGRPKALEGIGGRKAREFGLTEQAEMERFAREGGFAEIPEGLHANPVFNPRFWQAADAAIRPFTQKIDAAIGRAVGKLPFSIRRWLRDDPATKRIIQETRRAVGERQSETEAVLRMVLRENPTPAELAIADRIARGVPEDLSSARPEMRPILEQAAQDIHGLAQQMTSERSALGLPIREEWVAGPRRWYPNLWKQHLANPRMVAGRLFSKLRLKRAELGSLRPRTTDRYTVVDSSGTIARTEPGNSAIFRTMGEAQAFVGENPGRRLRIVEPMTHEQAVAHGLIEDLAVNLRQGFGKEWALLAKTRALETIGREFASDTPRPGYVNLGERGFQVPVQLAKRNPHIARLRDGYVPDEMASTLAAYYGPRGAFSTFFRAIEGSLRRWVTIRNPFRHPKQLIENELTLAFGDPVAFLNFAAKGRAFQDYARGARGEQNVPYWDEYKNSNLWYSDIVRGEFETVWRGVDSVSAESSPLSLRERIALWAEENAVARQLMASDRFAEKLYRAEDQVYKFYEYRTLRERGLSPQEAEFRASRTFFDYSDVPPIIRGANRIIPFAPNVTYQFSRIIGTALRDRPVSTAMKIALLVHGYAFVREEMMRAAGITEEDEKNMGKLAPAWHELVLPATDSRGRNIKVSILWVIPYGELLMLKDILSPDDPERGAAALAHRVVPMVAQPIVTVATSRKSFGQKFLTGTETTAQANRKRASEFIKGYLPGLLGQYWDRLYKNAAAGEERKKPLLQKALVEPVTGRIERFTPEGKIGLRKALIAGKAREVQEEAGRQRGRFIRGTTSAETFREEVGKLRTRITQEGIAHPETVAVLNALERGGNEKTQAAFQSLVAHGSRTSRDEVRTVLLKLLERNQDARAAFRKLTRSGFYETPREALEALVSIQRRKARLIELEQAPLPEARAAVEGVLEELRRTGRVSRAARQQLTKTLKALSQSDQNAILDWLQDQITTEKGVKERERRRTAPTPGVPRARLQPVIPGTELRPVIRG